VSLIIHHVRVDDFSYDRRVNYLFWKKYIYVYSIFIITKWISFNSYITIYILLLILTFLTYFNAWIKDYKQNYKFSKTLNVFHVFYFYCWLATNQFYFLTKLRYFYFKLLQLPKNQNIINFLLELYFFYMNLVQWIKQIS